MRQSGNDAASSSTSSPGGGDAKSNRDAFALARRLTQTLDADLDSASMDSNEFARQLRRQMTLHAEEAVASAPASGFSRWSHPRNLQNRPSEHFVRGHIRVRIVEATNLRAVERHVVPWLPKTSNPFASIYLKHQTGKQSRPRKTKTQKRTQHPRWRAAFEFSVQEPPPEMALHVDVFHQRSEGVARVGGVLAGLGVGDQQFLGHAELPLSQIFTETAGHRILERTRELDLKVSPDCHPDVADVSGTIKLEIGWDPLVGGKNQLKSTGALWLKALSSPPAVRVVHTAILGAAGLVCLVATNCRWLCEGEDFRNCKDITVPGASTCTALAGMAALMVMLIHFLGTAGLFGSLWTRRPLSLLQLIEKDAEDAEFHEEEEHEDAEDSAGLTMKVKIAGGPGSGIDAKVSLLPRFGRGARGAFITWIRVFSMLLNLVAMGFCGLALLLVFLRLDSGSFGAEAFWLDGGALALIGAGFFFSLRERRLMANLEPRWVNSSEVAALALSRSAVDGVGGIWMGDPQTVAQRAMHQAVHHAETLTQPLLQQANQFEEKFRVRWDELASGVREKLEEEMMAHQQRVHGFRNRLGGDQGLQAGWSPQQWVEKLSPNRSSGAEGGENGQDEEDESMDLEGRFARDQKPRRQERRSKDSPRGRGAQAAKWRSPLPSREEESDDGPSIEGEPRRSRNSRSPLLCFTCQ